ncbi:RXT2-like protein [Rhizophagus clarus]|uniref:RXT2-like protein n=1 Tax=Rhizophagus clarus TaxID=94130 RepID=A0A8H3M7D1_9GLOM|nr:RXT2-like protein [Rhizophagus clarus]
MKDPNGTTSASAPTSSGRRQSIAPQQPVIPQGSLPMRPNFPLNHPQTSLQQTNINHTGLMIQRSIAPGMQQVGPGPAGVPTYQNVSGQQLPISPNSRVPQGIRQSPQASFYSNPMYPPVVDQTSNYRSVSGTNVSVRPPPMSSGRMNLPPQQSSHQSSVNMPTLPHTYNPPLHHTSQQSNPTMLPPQSMQPHLSPRLSSSHSDLQSASSRTTRPQLANPMVVHDTRPSSTSTLTQGVQQLSLHRERSSIQETPSKMTPIPHAALRPTEGQRSMQESGPQAMQGIQPISHTPSRTSSQSYVSDAPQPLISQSVQLTNSIRNNPKLLPQQHAPIQPAQRISQKPNSPIISQASIKTSQASPKPLHSSTKSSHRSHKNGHHNSQKSIHQSTQLTASQQSRAEITEAAQVLYMSSRSREDPHRYGLNAQYATMNNMHINPGEGSHYIHHRARYSGPMSLDNSMTRGMNDESISREQDIGLVPHNRGHKMKHRAEALDSGVKLRAPYGYVEDKEEVEIPNGTRRPIIYRENKEATDQATEFEGDPDDNPYKDINVEDILGPLEKPEDAVRKSHYRRILKSKHLESLANELMERIEKEHEFNKKISRLMIVLQGDDDMYQELDFRLNPPPETVSTRVFKAEEVEGGKNFGVLNVGLQGNDRSKGKRAQEAKDQGLENLIMVREQLQEQLENSNEILRRYNETREGVLKAIRQKNMIYRRLCEIDKHRKKEEKNNDKTSTPLKKHLHKDKEKEREKEKEKEREA